MTYSVGTKGQVVIEKRIRDRLGVAPGWRALQAVVDDHVEIRFVPPAHDRSLAGCLGKYVKRTLPDAARDPATVVYTFDTRFPSEGIEIRADFTG